MKKAIIFVGFLLVCFAPFLSAQFQGQVGTKLDADKSHYRQGDELWLNDTTVHYDYINDSWQESERRIIYSRDGLGQDLQTIWEVYDAQSEEWIPSLKNNKAYYYFDDNVFVKENITFRFNTDTKDWEECSHLKFNNKDQLVERISMDWDTDSNKFLSGVKEVLSWDNTNELTTNMIYGWDVQNQTWTNDQKWTYTFDDDRKVEKHFVWQENEQNWLLQSLTHLKFDGSGNMIEESVELYNESGNELLNKVITERTFSEKSELTELVRTSKSTLVENTIKERNYYSADGKLLKKVIFHKLAKQEEWSPVKEIHHKYRAINDVLTTIERRWDLEKGLWIPYNRKVVSINEDKRLELVQIFDGQTGDWINVSQTEEFYAKDQILESVSSKWDISSNSWIPAQKQIYDYNEKNLLEANSLMFYNDLKQKWSTHSESLWQYDEGGNLIEFEFVRYDENGISNARKSNFGWHMFSVSKTENKDNYTIDIYPNPTKGVLHVKSIAGTLSRIAILDQYGRLIEAISLDQQSTTIDISHLQAGNYFIECKNGIKKNTFKVVKL